MCTKIRKSVFFSPLTVEKKALSHDNHHRTEPDAANPADQYRQYAGKKTGFIRRQRQVTGAGFAQTLVLGGLAQPNAMRKQQQQAAAQVGMPISAQGLEQRFTAAVDFMK
jgi:hypothetical protein